MPRTNPPRNRKREAEAQDAAKPHAAHTSPSQPVRKRRKANTTGAAHPKPRAPRTPEIDDTDDENDDAVSTTSSGHAVLQELADYVVPWLNAAAETVNVAEDHSDRKNERTDPTDLQAYAKIAGRGWTYYVRRVSVDIGRHPDALSKPSLESGGLLNGEYLPSESTAVDIDLGPSKHVSRLSATIFYEPDAEDWRLLVQGRNSLKVNEKVLRRGQQIVLHSGDIIDIANTQMIFVLAQEKAMIHPNVLDVMGWRSKIPQRLLTNTYARRYQDFDQLPHAHPETPSRSGRLPAPNTASSTKQRNGQSLISPAPPNHMRPTTPDRSPDGIAPLLAAASPSPNFHRSRVNGAAPIDYSLDEHAAEKPTATYTVLITQAILSTPEHMLTLAGIYKFMQDNYAYFRKNGGNWQNSVRHNLSLAVGFQKVPRRSNEPGKGMKWTLNPDPGEKAKMIAALEKHLSKGTGPASPTVGELTNSTRNPKTEPDRKPSPIGSPPMSAYPPTAPDSYTPTRGPHLFNSYPVELTIPSITRNSAPEQIPEFSEGALPVRSANGSSDNAAPQDSPSSAFPPYTMLSGDQSMFTPAPKRQNPRLAAPSTARLPSSFMFDSSPAPFWKYPGLAGSTPARGIDLSPMKAGPLQSSSPPPAHTNGVESPTRPRRLGESNTEEREKDVGLGVDVGEEEEEAHVDLTRGFQSIGSFHKQMTAANNAALQPSFS